MDLYRTALRPLLFTGWFGDPETLHGRSIDLLTWLAQQHQYPLGRLLRDRLAATYGCPSDRLCQTLWGVQFPNPLGLAAGFDKDGTAAAAWQTLGFGFAELGTVTHRPQPGNPQPRLFRLPRDRAALNRMGFNNQGAARLAESLQDLRRITPSPLTIPLGINLGKSKMTPLDGAPADYLASFRLLRDLGDYFVVNVSSPNTPGLRDLQDSDRLGAILDALQQANQGQKPILVKIAPDLTDDAIAQVIAIAQQHQLAGLIATNTTIRRDGLRTTVLSTGNRPQDEPGGLSGAPVRSRSTEVIRFIYRETGGSLPIIGVGGIFNGDDAWEKITAGASLIQTYTGLIYEGPTLIRQTLTGLLGHLDRHNLPHITAAIGLDHRQDIPIP
jgi:dihydroorotate dehydrogenase